MKFKEERNLKSPLDTSVVIKYKVRELKLLLERMPSSEWDQDRLLQTGSMIFHKMELYQNREKINDAVYDLRRTRSLSCENEAFSNNIERGCMSPTVNRESIEYASDSSCEGYREFQKQQTERRNSSPIAASSAFTIDSILGRNEKREMSRINSSGDKEEEQDDMEDRIEGHFVKPTAIPATRSGM